MTRSSPELIPEETLDRAVEILKAVANPSRLQIVNILLNGECQVSEIHKAIGIKSLMRLSSSTSLSFPV